MSTSQPTAPLDPLAVLKGLASLRRLTGTYPPGHPMIGQKVKELGDLVAAHLQETEVLRIDVIRGDVFLDSVASSTEGQANQQLLGQLTALGVGTRRASNVVSEPAVRFRKISWPMMGASPLRMLCLYGCQSMGSGVS